jgi:ribosomal protein L44E
MSDSRLRYDLPDSVVRELVDAMIEGGVVGVEPEGEYTVEWPSIQRYEAGIDDNMKYEAEMDEFMKTNSKQSTTTREAVGDRLEKVTRKQVWYECSVCGNAAPNPDTINHKSGCGVGGD